MRTYVMTTMMEHGLSKVNTRRLCKQCGLRIWVGPNNGKHWNYSTHRDQTYMNERIIYECLLVFHSDQFHLYLFEIKLSATVPSDRFRLSITRSLRFLPGTFVWCLICTYPFNFNSISSFRIETTSNKTVGIINILINLKSILVCYVTN